MNVINVNGLTKDYGSGRGVFDVTFNVKEGEVFGFLGPNGAGKSTTIRHLMGFSKPQSGDCKIFDLDTFKNYNQILMNVGYIPGEIALPAGLTGNEFIKMMQDLQGIHNEERLNYLLELFQLDPNIDTKKMSLGVKRKLAIVSAFMSDPKVLILDEPTSGLDPVMQEVFIDFIRKEKERGKTILLSSHIFSEVDATCDRIAIIKDGHLVSNFIADDLRHSKSKFYSIYVDNKLNELINDLNKFEIITKEKDHVTIMINDDEINLLMKIIANYEVKDFVHHKETLEDYFMKYYKEDRSFEGVNK